MSTFAVFYAIFLLSFTFFTTSLHACFILNASYREDFIDTTMYIFFSCFLFVAFSSAVHKYIVSMVFESFNAFNVEYFQSIYETICVYALFCFHLVLHLSQILTHDLLMIFTKRRKCCGKKKCEKIK